MTRLARLALPIILLAGLRSTATADVVAQTKETQAAITPHLALQMLKEGNERFASGTTRRRNLAAQIKATGSGQYPFASIVSCIDSRSGPELVFDQGLGDIFAARVAGNIVDDDILGSLEFASRVAGSKLIVVLGHSSCGAIKGACDGVKMGHLTGLLAKIQPAVDAVPADVSPRTSKNDAFVEKVAEANVRLAVRDVRERSDVLREMQEKGEIAIVGAMLDVKTGRVTFYEE
jgi:carbonic anhydrase